MRHTTTAILLATLLCTISGCDQHRKPSGISYACTVEVDQAALLRSLSDHSTDTSFNNAIASAQLEHMSESKDDFTTLFAQAYKGNLSSVFGYVPRYQKSITLSSSNEDIIRILRDDMKGGVQKTADILLTRAKNMGESAIVSVSGDPDHISVKVANVFDTISTRRWLLGSGRLEFWDTYENEEMINNLVQADKVLQRIGRDNPAPVPVANKKEEKGFFDGAVIATDTSGNSRRVAVKEPDPGADSSLNKNPLFMILSPMATENKIFNGPAIGVSLGKDTAQVNKYLSMAPVRACFPKDVKFLWSGHPIDRESKVFYLYAIKTNLAQYGAPITGDMISSVRDTVNVSKKIDKVIIWLNMAGTHKWEMMTEAAANGIVNGQPAHRSIAIVLDDKVISAPAVQSKITGGKLEIEGLGADGIEMGMIFRSGVLPVPVRLMNEQITLAARAKE